MTDLVAALGHPWLASVLLLATRLGALFLMTPLLYSAPLPPLVRVLLVLGLAGAMALPFADKPLPLADLGGLLKALLRELAVGATLGLGVLMAFGGFALAGRLIDVQVGFGMAQVFDPLTRSQVPALSSVVTLVGVLLFFLLDGPHALLRGIAYSLERFPLGQPWSLERAAPAVLKQAAGLFTLGFALAAPVVLCLLLLEFVLGVVARSLPQVNMFVLGIPVKIVVGLLALSFWAGGMGAASQRLYAEIYRGWSALFDGAAAAQERR
ncbi:MAG TPA: flagellar biosynthetic protein FliR [Ramlibacter sp.]|nr:flagellar biosynthetic protein FliR [Ramlibacter sp.]